MWSADRETRLEVDASGYATGGVLSQKGEDGLWHPIAYRSASMTEAEQNYEIYDREMLAFCEALKDWRHFLEGLAQPFEVWTDHANLQYWRTAQHLTRQQARWALLLADFNFVLVHKAGTANTRADPLSRMPNHAVSDADDNREEIVLKPEHFKIAATKALSQPTDLETQIRESSAHDEEVAEALAVLKKKGPRKLINSAPEWEEVDRLIYYKGKLYIPNDKDIRAEIVKSCHDSPTAGHLGKNGTLELVQCHYWWPRMGQFIERYVLGCDQCQRMKPALHPKAPLQPQPVPEGPWQFIGVDLITQLPESRGYDSICVYVDHHSDQCHLIPCTTKINAEGVADLHYKEIFRLHGVPQKIYSDRGPQFAARFMRALYKRLGINTGFTTAYHPQGNGKVERKNKEVEQYLRLFCHKTQDDWVDHLSAAEFALNSQVSSATGYSPFKIIYSYRPDWCKIIGQRSNLPSLEERLDRMAEVRKEAEASLRLSKEKMRDDSAVKDRRLYHEFKVGDLVLLSAKDVKIHQKSPKLGPKQLGPFKVLERIGNLDYRLELPAWLKIHNVIHVNRLAPWKDNGLDKPPPPEPEVVDGEEVYEVEEILDSRFYRRQFQYLVKWVGYPGEDTWEPLANVKGAKAAIAKFHKEHPGAPRVIKALIYADLLSTLRRPSQHTSTDYSELQELYPKTVDLGWEDGKYL
jgi:transposase InsO family protein